MNVGVLLIATRRYAEYLSAILRDIDDWFLPTEDRQVYLFTDRIHDGLVGVRQFQIPSYGFPWASLYRFAMFSEFGDSLDSDFLYYMDVDMRILSPIGKEVLPDESELVGVHHARCWSADGTWETRVASNAYVPPEQRLVYYAGGFFGGTRKRILEMSRHLEAAIRDDEQRGLMAVWHDESHMNRYFADHPPKLLSPVYCFPPNPAPELEGFQAKIECLLKDHKAVRGVS